MQTTGTERLHADLKQTAALQMKAEDVPADEQGNEVSESYIWLEVSDTGCGMDTLLLVSAILEDLYEIIAYRTGAEGLAGLRRAKPDLVLLDISLPGMEGLEVLKEIRTDSVLRDLLVIALTAHAMEGDREALLAAGFNEYVVKPIIEEQRLLDAIASLFA